MPGDFAVQRGMRSLGFAGPVAFLTVFWAASLGGTFDWGVFWIALAALFMVFARTLEPAPIRRRFVQERDVAWVRRDEQDWYLPELFSAMSGAEIDQLRTDVAHPGNAAVQAALRDKAPNRDDEHRRRVLVWFIADLSDIDAVFADANGPIQAYDR